MIRTMLIAWSAAFLANAAIIGHVYAASDQIIRIATWDLHDLWHETGKPLRNGARVLTKTDLDALRQRARNLTADIVALQGVGSKKAAHLLFPAKDYYVIFSRELAIRLLRDRDMLTNPARRRVYTAFAIRRAGPIRMLARENILELADPSPQLGAGRPQGQSGLAIRVRINKRPVWVLNARLISGCHDDKKEEKSETEKSETRDAQHKKMCTVLKDQIDLINQWKSLKRSIKEPVIMAVALPRVPTTNTHRASSDKPATATVNDEIWSRLLALSKTSPRTRKKGRNRAARFALTNRTVATEDNRAPGALQPNTVALTGPTRRPGQRLVPGSKTRRSGNENSNFIVDALTEFANTKRATKPKTSSGKPTRLTLGDQTAAGLKQIAPAPTKQKKPKARNNEHFVQYPVQPDPVACHSNTLGENYLIVTRALKDADKKTRFAIAKAKASPSGTTQQDCPVYVDIPRRKT